MNPYLASEYTLVRTTVPTETPITLAECKAQLDVTYDDDDTLITDALNAAVAVIDGPEGKVGKALVSQGWTWKMGQVTGKTKLSLPLVPFQSVTSIRYYDTDDVLQTENLADYVIYGGEDFGYIEPDSSWPAMKDRPDALEIVFVAGYGAASAVPANLKQACKMLVSHFYAHREAVDSDRLAEIPMGVTDLISLSRKGWFGG